MVVFISLDVEETNDTLTGDSCHQTLTNPDGVEEFRVTSDSELDFAIRYELFGQVKLELNQEKVRSDDDHRVFLFVEEDILD